MSIKQTQTITCDHINQDGQPCLVERAQHKIDPTEPMYRIQVWVHVIDAQGETELIKQDVHVCYWDLFYLLSNIHEQAKIDVESRKQNAHAQGDLHGNNR